jgi:hypothetical protein
MYLAILGTYVRVSSETGQYVAILLESQSQIPRFLFLFVRLLVLRPLLAYCASLG